MLEVEAKVPVSRNEYQSLKLRLLKMTASGIKRVSADSYYEKSKACHIRIRQSGNKNVFTIKRRQTVKGIESNFELEWGIKDIGRWRQLLKRLRMRTLVRKYKKSLLFTLGDYTIELNYVRKLGFYLEIENKVKHKTDVPKAKKELIALYQKLGYSQKQFEPRPYLQLLENV